MKTIIKNMLIPMGCLLFVLPAGAVTLSSDNFSSDGSSSSAVSGESSSSNFDSLSSGGEGSADGDVEGLSFKNDSGFAKVVDQPCPEEDDGSDDYTSFSRVGDPCDSDDDDDGVPDENDGVDGPDNCPMDANAGQEDFDSDDIGDVCDPDDDNDNLPDIVETEGSNPTDPLDPDTDGDGVLDGDEDANMNGVVDVDEDGNPIETDPNNADSDGDLLTDGQEVDNGLDPLDSDDAQEDPDLDTLVSADEINAGLDPLNPDSDFDDIQDNIDAKPDEANNTCAGLEATLSTLSVTQEVTCAARTSISVTGGLNGVEVLSNGELILLSPQVSFEEGFKVETGGTLSLQSIDPCPVCE